MQKNILVADDDPMQRALLEKFIKKIGHKPILMHNGQEVLDFFLVEDSNGQSSKKTNNELNHYDIDVILLDISMPHVDGFQVLERIKPIKTDLPIIVLTASKDTDLAIKAVNAGAFDYIVKGEVDVFARLFTTLNNAISQRNLRNEMNLVERDGKGRIVFSDIIAKSPKTKSIVSLLLKTVDLDIPILLQGENGTGKELFAKAIHGSSKRANKPFVVVNCAALPKKTADSVLFGHEKGYMGNISSNMGKFREAEGGTLFLDDVSELQADIQLKLLNVLKKGEIEPLGSDESFKINVRIVSTASKLLENEIKSGKFRADLFYRLNVFSAYIPPLRDRKEEIVLLADSFRYTFSITENKRVDKITDEALKLLNDYNWPGNIRQLRNALFRAVVLTETNVLDVHHFPQIIQNKDLRNLEDQISVNEEEHVRLVKNGNLRNFKEIESEIIEKIIKLCDGNISIAAKKLKMGRSTLYRKLKLEENKNDKDN